MNNDNISISKKSCCTICNQDTTTNILHNGFICDNCITLIKSHYNMEVSNSKVAEETIINFHNNKINP